MTFRQKLLSVTALAALLSAPALGLAQPSSGSSMPSTTQAAPSSAPDRTAQGATGTRDASGGVMAQGTTTPSPREGMPTQPPAAGAAPDRTLGATTPGASPSTTAAGAASGLMAIDSAALRNGRRASKVIGSNIYNENNESIGSVEDILIPQPASATGGTAPAPVAIVSVGGFLGIGAKLVAIPYDRLQWNSERNRWMLAGATKEGLTALPTFTYEPVAERRG